MNKLVKIIDTMSEEDLQLLKKDIDAGNLNKLIQRRLEIVTDDNKVCPVCGKTISGSDFVLTFGKEGLRMRASFDEMDCLKHFLGDLSSDSSTS